MKGRGDKMKVTMEQLEYVERQLAEVGYKALLPAEQAICDACDAGTIEIVSDDTRKG